MYGERRFPDRHPPPSPAYMLVPRKWVPIEDSAVATCTLKKDHAGNTRAHADTRTHGRSTRTFFHPSEFRRCALRSSARGIDVRSMAASQRRRSLNISIRERPSSARRDPGRESSDSFMSHRIGINRGVDTPSIRLCQMSRTTRNGVRARINVNPTTRIVWNSIRVARLLGRHRESNGKRL